MSHWHEWVRRQVVLMHVWAVRTGDEPVINYKVCKLCGMVLF